MKTSTAILTGIGAGLLTMLLIDAADASEPSVSDYCGTMGKLAYNVAIDRDNGYPAHEIVNNIVSHVVSQGSSPSDPVALDMLQVVDNAYVTPHLRPSVEQAAAYEQCLMDKGVI